MGISGPSSEGKSLQSRVDSPRGEVGAAAPVSMSIGGPVAPDVFHSPEGGLDGLLTASEPEGEMGLRARLEASAMAEFRAAVGTVRETRCLMGMNGMDSVEVYADGRVIGGMGTVRPPWPNMPPFKVRVVETPDSEIRHWNDNHLDPYWNVVLVDPHPAIPAGINLETLWIDGPSSSYEIECISKPGIEFDGRNFEDIKNYLNGSRVNVTQELNGRVLLSYDGNTRMLLKDDVVGVRDGLIYVEKPSYVVAGVREEVLCPWKIEKKAVIFDGLTEEQIWRIRELDEKLAEADNDDDDEAFCEAVAEKNAYLEEQGIVLPGWGASSHQGRMINTMEKQTFLEDLCYEFHQAGEKWWWQAPSDSSELEFDSESEAVNAAWRDAVEQTMGIQNLSDENWDALSFAQQQVRIREALVLD